MYNQKMAQELIKTAINRHGRVDVQNLKDRLYYVDVTYHDGIKIHYLMLSPKKPSLPAEVYVQLTEPVI